MMLFKLALSNIKKSFKDYSIYFITLVISVSIFYLFNSIEDQQVMLSLNESSKAVLSLINDLMGGASIIVAVILGFLVVYANNFILRRRKKEIGLYMTLGMSKSKVSFIFVLETFFIGVISLAVGLFFGIVLSQASTIFIANLFKANLNDFQFIFSVSSTIKTAIFFGIIFLLVMIFNIIILRKYKIITLLKAKKQNESTKLSNKYLLAIAFIISLVLYYIAYSRLHQMFNSPVIKVGDIIICGSLATYLFYYSVSGVIINIISKYKPLYYKGCNMFTLRQINSRINSRVLSTSVITLLVLLTIASLSISTSLVNSFNQDYEKYMIADHYVELNYDKVIYGPTKTDIAMDSKYLVDSVNGITYTGKIQLTDVLTKKAIDKSKFKMMEFQTMSPEFMSTSDYNKLMKFVGKDKISLKDDEILITCNYKILNNMYKDSLKDKTTVDINGKTYKIKNAAVIEQQIFMDSYPSNYTTIIINDKHITNDFILDKEFLMANLIEDDSLHELYVNNDFYTLKNIDRNDRELEYMMTISGAQLEESSIGSSAMITFLGLYMGIILCITSASVLAIQQLSSSSDSKENFKVLRDLGATDKMRNKALFIEVATVFLLPVLIGAIHAFFGLAEINNFIMLIKEIDLTASNIFVASFIIIGYGTYFIATYLCSKVLVKDN